MKRKTIEKFIFYALNLFLGGCIGILVGRFFPINATFIQKFSFYLILVCFFYFVLYFHIFIHELGHLVMHLGNPPCSSDDAERQADEFASEFLMPEEEIRPMLLNVNIQTLGMLKRKWRVSMHALVRRAKDLETITYQQYRNLQMYFSKKGYAKSEPIPLPLENPTMWDETLKLYRDELGYSDEDLMSVMKINQRDFASWFSPKPRLMSLFRR